jgi:Fe-S-cluster-containing dehydrogenase component
VTLLTSVAAYDETPVDRYLAAQAELSAVDRFSQRHAAEDLHALAPVYRDLLPASPPAPGQQYAFEVDLDACTGCKACVSACHSLNGLDEGESWRAVTTVTAACHHCVDPACLAGCPVDAYEKDAVTGIVSHLDDQCIGCSYCTLTCPYEVPRFNDRLGIVRKCDMCKGRLVEGEAPACVQGCPNEAIRITVVETAEAIVTAEEVRLFVGAPPSRITNPTTVYRGTNTQRDTPPVLTPSDAHTPLAVMLVLTQVAVGAFAVSVLRHADTIVALGAALVAFGASVGHLGRPQYAYRAWIGLRHSWLSREVVAFGGFMGLGALYALTSSPPVGAAATLAGLGGVFSSVMVYVVTRRPSWRFRATATRFGLTTLLGALVAAVATSDYRWRAVSVAAGFVVVLHQFIERDRFFTQSAPPR